MKNCFLRQLLVYALPTLFCLCVNAQAASETDTTPFDFARAFVDVLVETHKVEELADSEVAAAKKMPNSEHQLLLSAIRSCTRTKLNLNVMIRRFGQMHLADESFKEIPGYLVEMYTRKVDLCDEIVQASKTVLEGPKPGVDYGKIAGHVPEVTAQMEYTNETIFKATPMIALAIVSRKPDSKNHLSHLSITKTQSKELIDRLQSTFGKSLDAKNQNWTTSSASLLRTVLRDKGYKYSDDPWL